MSAPKIKHPTLPGIGVEQTAPRRSTTFLLELEEEAKSEVKILGGNKRGWQKKAFKKLKDKRFAFCTAFCGSGKSILQVYLAAHDYIKSRFTQKQLLIVPQSVIANGFVSDGPAQYINIKLDRKKYVWRVADNFCDDRPGVLDALQTWLTKPVNPGHRKLGAEGQLTGGIAVTTHQALNLVWQRLKPEDQKKAIKNLTLRVDEAHHIKGVFDQEGDIYTEDEKVLIEEESTHLGDICRTILNSTDRTAKLHLTTATPYRGDQGIILSPKARDKFTQYFLPWLDHWLTLGIETFSIEYEEYEQNPFDQVLDRIVKEPKERHMIVVPATNQKWRTPTAYASFMKKLYRIVPKAEVLDLVTKELQDENRAKLLTEPKHHLAGASKYRVVVTCMIGREGLDWVPCSRLHNTAVERSLTLAVQTSGRPLRMYGPKTVVRIFNYVEALGEATTQEEKRQLFSDRTNGVLLGMQWDDMCATILVPEIPKKASDKVRKLSLLEVFGDAYPSLIKMALEEATALEDFSFEGLTQACEAAIDEYPPQANVREEDVLPAVRAAVARQYQRSQSPETRKKMLADGIDIAFLREAGFDKVVETYGISNRAWFIGEHGEEDWKAISSIVRRSVQDFEGQCIEVEAYLKRKAVEARD